MWRFTIPLLVLILTACSAPAVRVIPIAEPLAPYRLNGFSILAPGPEWYLVDEKPDRIGFVRYGRSWDDAWSAEAQTLAIPFDYRDTEDFFGRLAVRRDDFSGDPRYDVIEARHVRERFQQMECYRSRLAVRDRGAINRGASLYLLLQVVSLSCLHPQASSRMIDLRFSHRGRKMVAWEGLESEASAFFSRVALSRQ